MPLWEYQCKDCGHIFEELRTIHDKHEIGECPHCETLTGEYIPSVPAGYKIKGAHTATSTPRNTHKPVKKRDSDVKS